MAMRVLIFYFLIVCSSVNCGQTQKIDSLKNLLNQNLPDTQRVNSLGELARLTFDFDVKQAFGYADKAIQLGKKCGHDKGTAEALYHRGYASYYSGDFAAAKKDFAEGEKLFSKRNDLIGVARMRHSLGILKMDEGDYAAATQFYLSSLSMFEKAGNEAGQASELLSIGMVYAEQKMYSEAVSYQQRSIALYRKLGRKAQLANAITRLGNTYWVADSLDIARQLYDSALAMFTALNYKRGVGIVLNNLAGIYAQEKNAGLAVEYYLKALKVREELGDSNGIALIRINMSEGYLDAKDPVRAIANAEAAMKYFIKSHNKEAEAKSYSVLARAYAQQRNYEKAYSCNRRFMLLNDSLRDAEGMKQVHELNKKYSTEKKDRELLMKDAMLQREMLESHKKTAQRNYLIAGLAILLLLGVVLLFSWARIRQTRNELARQKLMLEQKNKEVHDSIQYASRIQRSLLPSERQIEKSLRRIRTEP